MTPMNEIELETRRKEIETNAIANFTVDIFLAALKGNPDSIHNKDLAPIALSQAKMLMAELNTLDNPYTQGAN